MNIKNITESISVIGTEIGFIKISLNSLEKVQDNLIKELAVYIGENEHLLRPMRKEDVFKGQFIFGKNDFFEQDSSHGWYCYIIEEVLNPEDDWKGFEINDGCRCGLYGSYVLKEM